MKYLSDYLEKAQTAAFNKAGAFFAFSKDQLAEKQKEGVTYISLGSGLISPKNNAKELLLSLDAIHQGSIAADMAENGIKAIIHRELANYECQITGDFSDAVEALESYGITDVQVKAEWREYFNYCVENDYF